MPITGLDDDRMPACDPVIDENRNGKDAMIILLLAVAMTAILMGATIVSGLNDDKTRAQKISTRK